MKKLISSLLAASMTLALTGCGGEEPQAQARDLMTEVQAREVDPKALTEEEAVALTDFGLKLLQATHGEDLLLSPLSVAMALAMTANGAGGDTLAQLEAALGLPMGQLNQALHSYAADLPQSEKARLLPANSIWYAADRGLTVEPDFLQRNADCYGAQLFELPFDDTACDAINGWVSQHTQGMIPAILEELSPEAVMCLVNALAFEAEWSTPYEEYQVSEGSFQPAAGDPVTVDFLHSQEWKYLENESCRGMAKPYQGGYEFVALLPKKDLTPAQLLAALDGGSLHSLLTGASQEPVFTAIPKLEVSFSASLVPALKALGVTDAFDADAADFTPMGSCETGPLYIGDVLHRTFLSLGEQGTRAGAATAVIMEAGCAPSEEEPKEVILDRPFVYMLVDSRHQIPFFLGTVDRPAPVK